MSEEISPRRSGQMTWFFVVVVASGVFLWGVLQVAATHNIAYVPKMVMGAVGIIVGGLMMRAYKLKGAEND